MVFKEIASMALPFHLPLRLLTELLYVRIKYIYRRAYNPYPHTYSQPSLMPMKQVVRCTLTTAEMGFKKPSLVNMYSKYCFLTITYQLLQQKASFNFEKPYLGYILTN